MYIPIHVHSEFSLLDGMSRVADIVQKAIENNTGISCITDHGNMFNIADHFAIANKADVKPIAGFEAYVVQDHLIKSKSKAEETDTNSKREHLLLLAKDQVGYEAISKICSIGAIEGFYYKPRIDDKILQQAINEIGNNHIIATSACLAGRIPRFILQGDMDGAIKWVQYYANLFKDNFYLEIQPTMEESQVIVNKALIDIAGKLGLPLLATTDSHYTNKEDAKAHELLLCLQTKTTWDNPKRWKFPGDTFWIMNEKQITKAFNENGHEVLNQNKVLEAIHNTEIIGKQCNVVLERGKYYLPNFPIPKNEEFEKQYPEQTALNYLKYQCKKGLKAKIKHLDRETQRKYIARLKYELSVIEKMKFETYFLVVQDYIKYANDNKIPTGPGRGCFTEDSKVQTLSGSKCIKDITLNDKVLCRDNEYHEISSILKYKVDEMLNHIASDNVNIKSTKDHKILAVKLEDYNKGDLTPHWYSSNDLQVGDYLYSV